MLLAIDVSCSSEAYLEGSSPPFAAVVGRGWGAARWLSGLHKWVMEYDSFSSLPCTTLGRGGRYSYIVYPGGGCQIGYIECYNS